MISAEGVWRNEGFSYCIDNGAWTAFQQKRPWDEKKFLGLIELFGAEADFVVVPDIVMGGMDSLRFSESWLPRLGHLACRKLIAVQNGMAPSDIFGLLDEKTGVFVGGDTEWKEKTTPIWADLSRKRRSYCHVGRVNTVRRINICTAGGVDSIDGSSVALFPKTLRSLDNAARQISLDYWRL